MELTIATAAIVEPGPTGVSSPSIADQRVGVRRAQVDDQVRLVEQAAADERVGLVRQRLLHGGHGDHPEAALPGATGHLDRHRREPARREDDHHVARAEREVGQDHLGQPGHPLDVHRLTLAVGADHLRVERHRQLDHRVEAGVRAVAREHLLDRDARMTGPEQVDETAAGDRVGTPRARFGDRPGLGLAEPGEQALGLGQPVEHARVGGGRRHGVISSRSRSCHRRRPPRWPRRARARPCAPGSRRGSSGSPSRRRASRRGP